MTVILGRPWVVLRRPWDPANAILFTLAGVLQWFREHQVLCQHEVSRSDLGAVLGSPGVVLGCLGTVLGGLWTLLGALGPLLEPKEPQHKKKPDQL